MTQKFSIPTVLGIGYILLMVGMTISSVGKPSEMVGNYTWTLPVEMLLVLSFAFLLGYAGAKEDLE